MLEYLTVYGCLSALAAAVVAVTVAVGDTASIYASEAAVRPCGVLPDADGSLTWWDARGIPPHTEPRHPGETLSILCPGLSSSTTRAMPRLAPLSVTATTR